MMNVVCYLTRKLHYLLYEKHEKKSCCVFITWPLYENITDIKTLGREKIILTIFIGLNSNMLVHNQF